MNKVYTVDDIEVFLLDKSNEQVHRVTVVFKSSSYNEYDYLWRGNAPEKGDYVLVSNEYNSMTIAMVVKSEELHGDASRFANFKYPLAHISVAASRVREEARKKHDALVKKRKKIVTELRNKLEEAALLELAKKNGLDVSALEEIDKALIESGHVVAS
jgi:hypothetical protein